MHHADARVQHSAACCCSARLAAHLLLPSRPPLLLAAWHCLACYGTATLGALLAHKERQQLQAAVRRQTGPDTPGGLGSFKPLRRPVHSSVSSLPSYGSGGWRSGKPAGGSPAGSSPAGSSPGCITPPRFDLVSP